VGGNFTMGRRWRRQSLPKTGANLPPMLERRGVGICHNEAKKSFTCTGCASSGSSLTSEIGRKSSLI
jgi:hypothetical protein